MSKVRDTWSPAGKIKVQKENNVTGNQEEPFRMPENVTE